MKWPEPLHEQVFKGYLPIKGKASMIPFKNSDGISYEEAINYPNADGVAGILKAEACVLDFDFGFQKALKIVENKQLPYIAYYSRTDNHDRGHLVGLNNGTFAKSVNDVPLAYGLIADVKVGINNSYAVIIHEGVYRNPIYVPTQIGIFNNGFSAIDTPVDFVGMRDGDGRDSALFSHILTLCRAGNSKDECRDIIRTINDFVFTDQMSDSDIERITRDGAFPNMDEIFFEKRTFRHDRLGQFLIHKMNIVRIHGQIHSYSNGFYISGTKVIESEITAMIPRLKDSQIRETLSYIGRLVKEVEPAPPKYIGFANGILDIESGIKLDFTPDIVITNRIPWNYEPLAESPIVDKCLNEWACGDTDIRLLLEEMAEYCLYRANNFQKMFILTGEKANGKSTFLDMITGTIGANNCSALDLASVGERFGTAQLAGKLANIGDDIADDFLDGANTAIIKKIVTGERLTAEFKGRDLFEFSPYAKMIFSANDIPRMKDRTGAMLRRLVIVPFNAQFDGKGDSHLREKLRTKEAMETMLKCAVEGLQRLLKRGEFTHSELVQAELESFEISNDPIKSFLKDYLQTGDELFRNSVSDVYMAYQVYCVENGYKSVNKNLFGRYVKKEYGLESYSKSVNGKIMKMYRKIA